MRRLHRSILATGILVIAGLAPCAAIAATTIVYSGDITTPTGPDGLWDYVYSLSKANARRGPLYWGIGAPLQPDVILHPDDWTGVWDSNITGAEYGGEFVGTALDGRAGVVWTWNGPSGSVPSVGFFRLQTIQAPNEDAWVIRGDNNGFSGSGTEWSPSPEPASVALTALTLLGVGWWRRRRKRAG